MRNCFIQLNVFSALPGQPASPKVVSAFKDCINLAWVLPTNAGGGSIIGYNLEKRKKGSNLWSQVNPPDEPIRGFCPLHVILFLCIICLFLCAINCFKYFIMIQMLPISNNLHNKCLHICIIFRKKVCSDGCDGRSRV